MDRRLVKDRLERERARLEEMRASLLGDMPRAEDTPVQGADPELSSVDQHPADPGSETFEREKDLAIPESLGAQLVEIDRAEGRIAAGTYGTCEACGRPIGEARLEAKPAARYCVEDQARAERDGRAAAQ
ncbi:MAG: TraR/DksA C4-type zinc finger protein [Actinobacteria bacterium]|nr:TraR/DksA C4-type zinc finger protein [Actinomycetota bacterium]